MSSGSMRGGIPLCWPQFSDSGPLQRHGFLRDSEFELLSVRVGGDVDEEGGGVTGIFSFESSEPKAAIQYVVTVQRAKLKVSLRVGNVSAQEISFTVALHTYFRAKIIRAVVDGLGGPVDYLDNLQHRNRIQGDSSQAAQIGPLDRETDRVYLSTPSKITLHTGLPTVGTILLEKSSTLPDAVLWNPWLEKAQTLKDLKDHEYLDFICIEAAAFGSRVQVASGETWVGDQTLHVVEQSDG